MAPSYRMAVGHTLLSVTVLATALTHAAISLRYGEASVVMQQTAAEEPSVQVLGAPVEQMRPLLDLGSSLLQGFMSREVEASVSLGVAPHAGHWQATLLASAIEGKYGEGMQLAGTGAPMTAVEWLHAIDAMTQTAHQLLNFQRMIWHQTEREAPQRLTPVITANQPELAIQSGLNAVPDLDYWQLGDGGVVLTQQPLPLRWTPWLFQQGIQADGMLIGDPYAGLAARVLAHSSRMAAQVLFDGGQLVLSQTRAGITGVLLTSEHAVEVAPILARGIQLAKQNHDDAAHFRQTQNRF
ncbi:hypothetical protein [Lacticaseibacillus saniviri]|nr:hypothetical protein [Lacticaseibacillus saniviri]MCG4281420.1 hypothetical protein [Lacticaseibacillus saniviri]